MTEQEFRERLKRAARNEGLSHEQQVQVLARIGKEDKTVRMSNHVRIAVAIVLVLMLGMTGAIAGGMGAIDWDGNPVPQPTKAEERGSVERTLVDLIAGPTDGKVKTALKLNEYGLPETGALGTGIQYTPTSVEEIQAWVKADGTLPWPVNIPSEYQQWKSGSVHYVCSELGEYRLIEQEATADGYITSYFGMPADNRFVDSYTVCLLDADGQELEIRLSLTKAGWNKSFQVYDDSRVSKPNVEGALQTIVVESAGTTQVSVRKALAHPLFYKQVQGFPNGIKDEMIQDFDCLDIEIIGQGTPEDLLAIFGLTAN